MERLNQLFKKEMSRKEFVRTAAFGLASILGFGTVLELLGKSNPLYKHLSGSVASYSTGYYSGFQKKA
jgi:hypothetical protein